MSVTSNFPVPDLVYAETCLKMARVLTTAYLNHGWNEKTLANIIAGKVHENEDIEKINTESPSLSIKGLVHLKKSGIPRHDIAEWVTKVWDIHIGDLALLDQIYITTSMSYIFSLISYHRKSAWMMYQGVERMLPLLIQHRRTGLSKENNKFLSTSHDSGVLEILKRICEIYGIGERNVHDGGALKAMQQQDHDLFLKSSNSRNKKGTQQTKHRFGWPQLQIDVLNQCISVSDALIDNGSRLYYTTVLLRNLYQYIPKAEQIKLATTIQGMVANSSHAAKKQGTSPELEAINYWGVNIVSQVEAKRPIPRKAVHAHPIKSEAVTDTQKNAISPENNDPFIYNPFAKKEIPIVMYTLNGYVKRKYTEIVKYSTK